MNKTICALSLVLAFSLTKPAAAADWSAQDGAALTAEITKGDFGTVTSLLVSRRGTILYEQYFGGADAGTLHNTRSATKTVAGMLMGAAIADGLIASVNEPVTSFFPDLLPLKNPDPRKHEITIEDILTMSSMLECNDSNRYSRGNEERMYLVENWVRFTLDLPIKGFAPWEERPEGNQYGRSFSYCTAGVHTLGQLVARASSGGLDDYAQKRLFAPLGIEKAEWQRTSLDRAVAAGGLGLSTRSFMKLGQLFTNKGTYAGKQVLPADWVEKSLQTHVIAREGVEYGYLIWKSPAEVDGREIMTNYMSGNGGNQIVFIPEEDLVIVLTKTDYNKRGAHAASEKLITDGVLKRLIPG